MVTVGDQLLSREQHRMVTAQNVVVTIANLKGFGLHLDSTEAHFGHKNRRKFMKNRSGQGRNRTADASLFRAANR